MQILLALGVSLLAAVSPAQAPQPVRLASQPVSITFVNTSLEDAISTIAKVSGVMIEIDQSVSTETRQAPITAVKLRDVSLEQALDWLTSSRGLSYSIVDGRSIRIAKQA